ncbi:helix-turn-helix domain-containing protein [Nonomuraea sp. NPDC055795]
MGLREDGLPISDAAIAAGFSDQSHLTRWFTRVYGLTPGAYQLSSTLA